MSKFKADPALRRQIIAELRVTPGERANLRARPCRWTGGGQLEHLSHDELDEVAKQVLARGVERLKDAQELLWADDSYSVLAVFQALDAAGKDSTIKHVMSGVNPQGVQVVGFRKPSAEELDHTYLWRIMAATPERGRIGIFNRSHYEEIVALKVHPEWISPKVPGARDKRFWAGRVEDINNFERHLDRNGTKVVKFFLHVSKDEQKRRFMKRLDNPDKLWKFNAADVETRGEWDDQMQAYEEAITATSTSWAPWYVLPADHKHVMQAMAAAIIAETIEGLDLRYPEVTSKARSANKKARAVLEAEDD